MSLADFDLNLLKVFATVAEVGSVTRAAQRLYVTQPAVSASLRRLTDVVGTELFVRQGRGLKLTERGHDLLATTRTHLDALVRATVAAPAFDPKTSRAIVRLGLEGTGMTFLAGIGAAMRKHAPHMQLVVQNVQFRTVEDALLTGGLTAAVCVADPTPKSICRESMSKSGGFVALYDGQVLKLPKRLTEAQYFAREHIIVSYAGDLRGIIEDTFGKTRTVRMSLPSFNYVATALAGTELLATVPDDFVPSLRHIGPQFKTSTLPFEFPTYSLDLMWARTTDADPAATFFRGLLRDVVTRALRR